LRFAHACLCSITATEIKRHHAYLDKEMEKMLNHKELAEEVAKKVSQSITKRARRNCTTVLPQQGICSRPIPRSQVPHAPWHVSCLGTTSAVPNQELVLRYVRLLQEKKRQEVLAEKDELVNDRSKLELKKMRAHQVPTATPP
jgi:hypothetical protein